MKSNPGLGSGHLPFKSTASGEPGGQARDETQTKAGSSPATGANHKVPWLAKRGVCESCDRRREAGIAANKATRERRAKEKDQP
jgi:hypothetical protein